MNRKVNSTNANNPYAPPEFQETEPQLAEGEYVLSENGILCRGSLALPAICLATGSTENLVPWKVQLATQSLMSRIVLRWCMTLLIGTSAFLALLELIRLWNEPGVSIPRWVRFGEWTPLVVVAILLIFGSRTRRLTFDTFISRSLKNKLVPIRVAIFFLFWLIYLLIPWNIPMGSSVWVFSILAFGFLWDVIEVRLLWSGTKLKSRETHSGLTEVTGFSGPFRRAIAEYVDAQKSRDITNNVALRTSLSQTQTTVETDVPWSE